jgi:hypothetical protein
MTRYYAAIVNLVSLDANGEPLNLGSNIAAAAAAAGSGISACGSRANSTIRTIVRPLRNLLFLVFGFTMATFVAANPPVPYRQAKAAVLGIFATSSGGTSLAAMQIKDPDTKVCLRITSSVCVFLLFMGYPLLFLRIVHRNAPAYVYGLIGCAFVLYVIARLIPPSVTSTSEHDDTFAWLDTVDLMVLAAVLVGILNAESSLLRWICSQAQGGAGDEEEEAIPMRGPGDEENQNPNRAVVATARDANGHLPSLVVARLANILAAFGGAS